MASKAPYISLMNITSDEAIYQRALIVTGLCLDTGSKVDFISVTSQDSDNATIFPIQQWPVSQGEFKCLLILASGENAITLQHFHDGIALASTNLTLHYLMVPNNPPLHLAIMVASDSPLVIDCPPHKRGVVTTAHSDIHAAIKKFRMTAYMWQAMTAEDMRSKGLGRRSFQLENGYEVETLSREYLQDVPSASHMQYTAKVHIVRSEKTIEEIRDAQSAQQNASASRSDRGRLYNYFDEALSSHGSPFHASAKPIVAGLILDSTYSSKDNLILGHAAMGAWREDAISLGIFGSHLTYSWPRFVEEIPGCLLDTTAPGETVGNDHGECATMWQACSVGQGAFLHQVGHAFSALHSPGIMARGYAEDWPKNFLAKTASTIVPGAVASSNNACWDISASLMLKMAIPHFNLPSDPKYTLEERWATPKFHVIAGEDEEALSMVKLVIASLAKVARIKFNDMDEKEPTLTTAVDRIHFTLAELEARFDTSTPLKVEVLTMNGEQKHLGNVWELFSSAQHEISKSKQKEGTDTMNVGADPDFGGGNDQSC